jgi:hypothetical protein
MTLDEILLKELARGPATTKEIALRLERRIRDRLDRLRVRRLVLREGKGGPHRQYTYSVPRSPPIARMRGRTSAFHYSAN